MDTRQGKRATGRTAPTRRGHSAGQPTWPQVLVLLVAIAATDVKLLRVAGRSWMPGRR
jgi:hypothetical protein